jgi:hypothetical protein
LTTRRVTCAIWLHSPEPSAPLVALAHAASEQASANAANAAVSCRELFLFMRVRRLRPPDGFLNRSTVLRETPAAVIVGNGGEEEPGSSRLQGASVAYAMMSPAQ